MDPASEKRESERPVTMEEVARAAGVSRSTVSRALSNHPRLPAERCEAIQKLAGEMGYRRNAMVSALMADLKSHRQPRTVNTLAYITAHPTREGWRPPQSELRRVL